MMRVLMHLFVFRKLCCLISPKWSRTVSRRQRLAVHRALVPATTCLRFTVTRRCTTLVRTPPLGHLPVCTAAAVSPSHSVAVRASSRPRVGKRQSDRLDFLCRHDRRRPPTSSHRRLWKLAVISRVPSFS